MSDERNVTALLTRANPVPDVKRLEPVPVGEPLRLEDLEQRSNTMTETKTPPTQEQRKQSTGWLVAAVLAAVIGIGALVISQQGGDTTPATQPPTPTTQAAAPTTTEPAAPTTIDAAAVQMAAAEQVIAALYVDGVALADAPWVAGTVSRPVQFFHDYGAAVGGRLLSHSCQDGISRITCELESIDDVSQAIDPEVVYNDTVTFIFDVNNEIQSAVWTIGDDPTMDAFYSWAFSNSVSIRNGDLCNSTGPLGDGTACALEHQSLVGDYLAEQ